MKRVGQLYREKLVNRIKNGVHDYNHVFVISYSGISGSQMSDFRKSCKDIGASVYVTKNSMAKIALKELQKEDLANNVEGQTAFIWGNTECVDISKVLVKFAKECEGVDLKGGVSEDRIIQKEDVIKLSELPSREVLLSMVLSAIQSPLTALVSTLNAKTRELLSILKQLSEKKGG